MPVYEISYDLNSKGQNYDELIKLIKSFGNWAHPLDSTWWIETYNKDSEDIYNVLDQALDSNDHIFITKITSDYYGYLPDKFWKWLKERL